MASYIFARRFAPLIREGIKRQTIRGRAKRHARPGERLQLLSEMHKMHKTPHEKIITDPLCTAVTPIEIGFASGEISLIRLGGMPLLHLDRFAVDDGFADIEDMSAFWREHHGARLFHGVVIEWSPVAERFEEVAP